MTTDDVQKRCSRIATMSGDDEAAHSAEDKLWDDVLEAIAAGAPEPHLLAAAALKTRDIRFARWCA